MVGIFPNPSPCQDALLEWEACSSPEEQEGKGVALKSCTQFFEWLKSAEPEEDEDEKPKVSASLSQN